MKYRIIMIDKHGISRMSKPICANYLDRFLKRIERIAQSYSIDYFMEYPL